MKYTRKTVAILAAVLAPSTAVVATVSLVTQPGCFVFGSPGPSAVGQGHQYKSGDPKFDVFFETLYELQLTMASAPDDEKSVRRELAKKLDVDQDASASLLAKKTKEQAEEMAAHGVGLKLEMDEGDDENKPTTDLRTAGAPTGADKTFVTAVERAVQKELELAHAMKLGTRKLDKLRALASGLGPQIDTTFRLGGPRKKAEVQKNLDDANILIPLMSARAEDVRDAAMHTAKKLAEAVETDRGSFNRPAPAPAPAETPEEPKSEPGKGKAKPKKHTGTGAAPHTPAPAPAPKPPPSDFEP